MSTERTEQKTGYVTSHIEYDGRNGPEINLGLATSPIGPAPELREPLRLRDPLFELSQYPQDPVHRETREIIINGIGLENVGYQSVIFDANGSYGAGDEVVRYLSNLNYKKILVPHYSFPNVAQWATRQDVSYHTLETNDLNPLASLEAVLTADENLLEGAIVYVDYPNNPFGLADSELVRAVIDKTSDNGGVPLIDMAFGEVLGEEFRNAMQYTIDHGGIVLSSLSKTQGLPGLRTGYGILPKKFTDNGYNGAQRMVFGLNREAEYAYGLLFTKGDDKNCLARVHAERVARYNSETNAKLITNLNVLGLTVMPTDLRTPIQTVVSDKPDFYKRLGREGIVTESLNDYTITLGGLEGYGNSAVRILTPKPGELEEVVSRVEKAIK